MAIHKIFWDSLFIENYYLFTALRDISSDGKMTRMVPFALPMDVQNWFSGLEGFNQLHYKL
jgi:hypothetical protein